MDNYFSSNLKYLREKEGLSKSELADKLKVNQSTISRWENGDMGVKVDNAYDVATTLNVDLPSLVGKDLRSEQVKKFNEIDELLFSKAKDLSDEDKLVVMSVIDSIKKKADSDK